MSALANHLAGQVTEWMDDWGFKVPGCFSDLSQESAALAQGVGLVDFSHHGVVSVGGADRLAFLSGLITNQMRKVTPHQTIHTALLTPQGRYAWDFTVAERSDDFLLIGEPDRVDLLLRRLTMYILRSKVTVDDERNRHALLGLVGPLAATAVQGLGMAVPEATPGAATQSDDLLLWRDPRHEAYGLRLLVPTARLAEVWDRLAKLATPVGYQAWETYRVAHALPRGGCDLIPEYSLPLESGYLELNAVDFSKGCFIGQETTARTHHRGTIKRRLYHLTLAQAAPALKPPATLPILVDGGKEAGLLTSLAGMQGLALLRVSDVESGKPLTLDGAAVRTAKPPWATW